MPFRFFQYFLTFAIAFLYVEPSQAASPPVKQDATTITKPVAVQESPTVITANSVEARDGKILEATGDAELRKDDQLIRADHMLFLQPSSELFADGSVSVEQKGGTMKGPSLKMNLEKNTGEMDQPEFTFSDAKVRGAAETMRIEGKQQYSFAQASYTSCPAGNDDWLLKMSTLELDRNSQIGTAYNARIQFMGVPILYAPWMTFPLNDQRRSGFLGPVLGSTNKGGSEITIPYYWNISNNYDLTFSPRFIEKRGALLENEFRYMGNSYSGMINYGQLSNDRLTDLDRSHTSLLHSQNFGAGFAGSLNLNEASDDAYFRDLSSVPAIATQKNLLREGVLAYTGGGWWLSLIHI